MHSDISLQLMSLVYILILSVVYFSKRKYNFLESKIYKFLLIITMFILFLDVFSYYGILKGIYVGGLSVIISKIYFVSLFVWFILFIFYVFLNKSSIRYDNVSNLLVLSFLTLSFTCFILAANVPFLFEYGKTCILENFTSLQKFIHSLKSSSVSE